MRSFEEALTGLPSIRSPGGPVGAFLAATEATAFVCRGIDLNPDLSSLETPVRIAGWVGVTVARAEGTHVETTRTLLTALIAVFTDARVYGKYTVSITVRTSQGLLRGILMGQGPGGEVAVIEP